MQTVTLTRQFSGFRNVPDTWIVGANDEKACMIRSYYLPYGYNVGEHPLSGDPVIVDPTGTICDIVTPPPPWTWRPQLVSGYVTSPVLIPMT